jgi:hypothetical protein
LVSPDWDAVTVQVPALFVIVNVEPTLVHTPELLNDTGSPEVAVAATVKLLLYCACAGAL